MEVDLDGKIQTLEKAREPAIFVMQLEAVRGTFAALDFGEATGKFKVHGSFEVDASKERPITWSAGLNGNGTGLRWKGIPLQTATAAAKLSAVSSQINASLSTPNGKMEAVFTRKGGRKETPFLFEGTIEDSAGRKDDFHGPYQDRTLTVASLVGNADLWSIRPRRSRADGRTL
jgi:hypothetical protein